MSPTLPASTVSVAGAGEWLTALREHEPWLRRVLWNRLGDRAGVEDVLQEVSLAASRDEIRPADQEKLPAWLYSVAVRQAYLYRRKLGRFHNFLTRAQRQGAVADSAASSENPLRWLLVRERQQAIENAFRSLSEMDREILLLKYGENWTYQQLADRLGVTVHTIEHRLLKAKKTLRRLLSENQIEDVA